MRFDRMQRGIRAVGAAGLLLLCARALQAQQGSISVRVTEAGSGRPVEQTQVNVVGTTLGALTNAEGLVTIRGVPTGTQQVRVLRVGFSEQKKAVTVTAGEPVRIDFELTSVAINLAPVVTTATGETRREELGNSVANIDAAKLTETAPIRSVDDALNARTPGVIVQTGSQTGTGSRVRIRGQSSLNLSNDPIYVIDGVRMTSNLGSNAYGTGGANASRVNDIKPEEIESIEVVKGPSAATLYGTDAANGVIVITTKRGKSGEARWSVNAETGILQDRNPYPYNYTIAGHSPNTTAYRECTLPEVSLGTCVRDSVRIYSPVHDPDATPIGLGNRYALGAQVSGGTDVVRYFLSAAREGEVGTLRLPDFERRRFAAEQTPIHDWTDRPNALSKNNFRANLNAAISPKLDVGAQFGFINLEQRYSLESNATAGLGSHMFGGPGYKDNCNVAVPSASPCNGYRAWTPGYTWQEKTAQRINRYITSVDATWRPFAWNMTRIQVGNDLTMRRDENLLLRGEGPPISATYRDGFKGNARGEIRNTTMNVWSTGSFNLSDWINSKTTVGANYVNYEFDRNSASGSNLSPGSQTVSGGATLSASEGTTLQKTLGLFIEEAMAFNDRLFVTAGVRSDQNSAFGTNFQSVFYPKATVSWIISDQSFFPKVSWIDQFRLRSAYGASGVQPGPNDALRSFSAPTANVRGTDVPSLINDRFGNPDLKPERSAEFEGGFESKLFKSRVSVDFTYYRKRTNDALISAVIAPSAGTGVTSVRRNLGAIQNQGFELLTNVQLVDRRAFAWDVALNGSTNSNKLISLGGEEPISGTTTRVTPGYPLFGWWSRPILGWQDKNGDGILTYNADPDLNEVFVGDTAEFRGYTQPRHLLTITNGFDLLNRRLRVQALLDYRGGYKAYNNTERIRCASRQNCSGMMNPNASLEDQAMVVGLISHPAKTYDGFFQDGTFLKLREVSVSYNAPQKIATLMGARSATFILTGRNLAKWTKYRGMDPENDYTVTDGGDVPSDFQGTGPSTYWIARISLGF